MLVPVYTVLDRSKADSLLTITIAELDRVKKSKLRRKLKQELLALAFVSGFLRTRYGYQRFHLTFIYSAMRAIRLPKFKLVKRFKFVALTFVFLIAVIPLFQAFEAHVVNVTAELAQIDPPIMKPPGLAAAWNDTNGASDLTDPINVFIAETDNDATHIFYTLGTGTDPNTVSNPICGDTLGGISSNIYQVEVAVDLVIKAVACDGTDSTAHQSQINTKVYTFAPVLEPVIETLQVAPLEEPKQEESTPIEPEEAIEPEETTTPEEPIEEEVVEETPEVTEIPAEVIEETDATT